MQAKRIDWLRWATHIVSLVPLAALLWTAWRGQLGPDPIGEATRRVGRYAITWLLLSLAPTAINALTGWGELVRVRRALGLYAFFYAALHLGIYIGVDYAFDWPLLIESVRRSPFILAGVGAFILLAPLAITSTNGWRRRLGRNWKRLHRLVYPAGALVVWHYAWNYKELRAQPLIAAAALAALLLVRLLDRFWARRRVSSHPPSR